METYLQNALRMSQRQTASLLPTSNLPLSFLQIDWPAPQDKKRECVAKGKNNQVTPISERLGLPAVLNGTMAAGYESSITHFAQLHFVKPLGGS